jgi:hypothetical protein
MLKRERFYDGHGNELHIDEGKNGNIKVAVNGNEIEVPMMKLFDMLKDSGQTKGKHAAKVYEVR